MRIRDITEARYQGLPLIYHSTGVDDKSEVADIVGRGIIEPRTEAVINGKTVMGVSLTRSFWFAENYNGIILGLDLNKIRQMYQGRMTPYADPGIEDALHYDEERDEEYSVGDYRREAEEFVIGPVSLKGTLVAIWLSTGYYGMISNEIMDDITPILNHPLFKGLSNYRDAQYHRDLKPEYRDLLMRKKFADRPEYLEPQPWRDQTQGAGKPKKASSPVLPA